MRASTRLDMIRLGPTEPCSGHSRLQLVLEVEEAVITEWPVVEG